MDRARTPRVLKQVMIAMLVLTSCQTPRLEPGEEQNATAGLNATGTDAFRAWANSAFSVELAWEAIPAANGYQLEVRIGDAEYLAIAALNAETMEYEHIGAPPGTELEYRLSVQEPAGLQVVGELSIRTPDAVVNPRIVQAVEYEPLPWSPPEVDLSDPNVDLASLYPPGFDPDNPLDFDPTSLLGEPVGSGAEIGPEGGELSVTSPDGVTYTLVIPPDALEHEITITLTPIASIDSYPLDGNLLGAVRIDPEGLALELPAELVISPSETSPAPGGMADFGFTYQDEGYDFHLYPFVVAGGDVTSSSGTHLASPAIRPDPIGPLSGIAVNRLQSYGVGRGTRASAASVIRSSVPAETRGQLANILAYGQTELPDLAPLGFAYQLSGQRLVQAAREARTWDQVMEALDNLEFYDQFYRSESGAKAYMDKVFDSLLEQLNKLLRANKEKCITKDDFSAQAFAQRLANPKRGSFSERLANRYLAKYGESEVQNVLKITKNCRLTLLFDSRITMQVQGITTVVEVSGSVPLRFKFANGRTYLTGTGEFTYLTISVRHSSPGCTPYENIDGAFGTLLVINLEPIFHDQGALLDYALRDYKAVGVKPATMRIKCKDAPPVTVQGWIKGGDAWGGMFVAAHFPEYEIRDWALSAMPERGRAIIAERIFDRPSFSAALGGGAIMGELSTFNLEMEKLE